MRIRRFFVLGVFFFSIFIITACGAKQRISSYEVISEEISDYTEQDDQVAMASTISNSGRGMYEVSESEELKTTLEIDLRIPSEAISVTYSIVKNKIAQASFIYNEIEYIYRASDIYKGQDLDEISESFTDNYFNIDLNGYDYELYTTVSGNRLVSWEIDDTYYSLYSKQAVENSELENLLLELTFGENVFGDARNIANDMLPLFHGLNLCLYETGRQYEPQNDYFYWLGLQYVLPQMEEKIGKSISYTENEAFAGVTVLDKLATNLYADRTDLTSVGIPYSLTEEIILDENHEKYVIQCYARDNNRSVISFASKDKSGNLIVESMLLNEENELLGTYHYSLELNTENDGFSLFPYSVYRVTGEKNIN